MFGGSTVGLKCGPKLIRTLDLPADFFYFMVHFLGCCSNIQHLLGLTVTDQDTAGWPNGKALDYESRDCRFDPCVGQIFAFFCCLVIIFCMAIAIFLTKRHLVAELRCVLHLTRVRMKEIEIKVQKQHANKFND